MVCFLHLPVWEPIKATLEILLSLCNILCFSSLQGRLVLPALYSWTHVHSKWIGRLKCSIQCRCCWLIIPLPHRGSQPITPSNRARSLSPLPLSPSDPLSLSVCLSLSQTHRHRHIHSLTGTGGPIVNKECIMVKYPAVILVMFRLACFESINKCVLNSPPFSLLILGAKLSSYGAASETQ